MANGFRVGAARVDITPEDEYRMAGYSTDAQRGKKRPGEPPLTASAFYLCDEVDSELVVCAVDLQSGTRALWNAVASKIGEQVPQSRFVLVGSHTHTGPGQMFGSMYDVFAQGTLRLRPDLLERTANGIALAVKEAKRNAKPGVVSIDHIPVWGLGSNQSLAAHQNSWYGRRWNQQGFPGAQPPPGLSSLERAVDPRLTAIRLVDEGHKLVGVLGVHGVHPTSLGDKAAYYSPDWCGVAAQHATEQIEAEGLASDEGVVVAFGGGNMADVGPLALGGSESVRVDSEGHELNQGPALQQAIGARMGAALVELAQREVTATSDTRISVAHREVTIDRESDPEIGKWAFGVPTVGGSEDGPSMMSRIAREGTRRRRGDPSDPQFPKLRLLPCALRCLFRAPPNRWPLHAIRIGSTALVTVPGEPTGLTGFAIRRALMPQVGLYRQIRGMGHDDARSSIAHSAFEDVCVLGYANEYAGYFTTEDEFVMQHYEGASTLFGRHQVRRLIRELVALADELGP